MKPVYESVEDDLLRLVDGHIAQYRRYPTSIALPVGTLQALEDELSRLRVFVPGGAHRLVLWHPAGAVTLVELPLLPRAVVLSDREPRG